jgi:hypothetical protein
MTIAPQRSMAGSRAPHPVAAIVDPRACSSPMLRLLAAELGGRGAAVIGSVADAHRAAAAGVRVVGCCAPPLGSVAFAGSALRSALGGPRQFGTVVVAGARAVEAAPAAGLRAEPLPEHLPEPLAPIAREELRAAWGVAEGESACVLLANPASACDARTALDIAGRTALLGGPVVLVVHPDSGSMSHARRLASAAGGAWRIALDARADEPELLSRAADAFLAVGLRAPADAERMPPRGLAAALSALARGGRPAPASAESIAVRLALRAGAAVVAADGTPGAEQVAADRRFDPRRPNVAARALRAAFDARG